MEVASAPAAARRRADCARGGGGGGGGGRGGATILAEQNAKLFEGLEARVAAGAHTLEPADLERCGMGASDAPFMRLLVKELRLNLEVKLPRFRCC